MNQYCKDSPGTSHQVSRPNSRTGKGQVRLRAQECGTDGSQPNYLSIYRDLMSPQRICPLYPCSVFKRQGTLVFLAVSTSFSTALPSVAYDPSLLARDPILMHGILETRTRGPRRIPHPNESINLYCSQVFHSGDPGVCVQVCPKTGKGYHQKGGYGS